ncbi:MAG: hypothetical protein MUE39_09340 [Gammaproteobacteria bacterium]|jgi:hypothetical protein|nr:hypothetical protein [Gammaproteobacteria bacterium]
MKGRAAVLAWRRAQALRREPTLRYRCSGGPFHGQQIVLTPSSGVSTFVFRVGDQVGRYVGGGVTVVWEEVA